MSSEFGSLLKISVFGQSHGRAIGVVVDGLPAGEAMDLGGTWTLPWAEGAAYTLAVKHNSDGTWTFNLFPGPYREG